MPQPKAWEVNGFSEEKCFLHFSLKQQTAHEALWMAQYGAVVFEN